MKTYTLEEADEMLENKKGVGQSKTANISINISTKGSITKTRFFITTIMLMIQTLNLQQGITTSYSSEVTTEFEDNPDWNL